MWTAGNDFCNRGDENMCSVWPINFIRRHNSIPREAQMVQRLKLTVFAEDSAE